MALVLPSPATQLSGIAETVAQEVAFAPANLGWPRERIHEGVAGALAALDISHLANRDPGTLSGGEMQRTVIAAMLVLATRALAAGRADVGARCGRADDPSPVVAQRSGARGGGGHRQRGRRRARGGRGPPRGLRGRTPGARWTMRRHPARRGDLARARRVHHHRRAEPGSRRGGAAAADGGGRSGPVDAVTPLVLEAVRFGYGAGPVLDGVSMRIGAGEGVALLGANGAGQDDAHPARDGAPAPRRRACRHRRARHRGTAPGGPGRRRGLSLPASRGAALRQDGARRGELRSRTPRLESESRARRGRPRARRVGAGALRGPASLRPARPDQEARGARRRIGRRTRSS